MKVYLSPEASDQLTQILTYLEERWSIKVRDNFLAKFDRFIQMISEMPFAFPASQKMPGLRKCVITPQAAAYYRIKEEEVEIEVVAIIDTRQNFGG